MTDDKAKKKGDATKRNLADIKAQLKKLEVLDTGRCVYNWEPVAVGDYPCCIVVSKTDLLLWGYEILQAVADTQAPIQIQQLTDADKVIAEWTDGRIEVMTDDDTKVFTSRKVWQEYWNALDEWPTEIDAEGTEGGAAK